MRLPAAALPGATRDPGIAAVSAVAGVATAAGAARAATDTVSRIAGATGDSALSAAAIAATASVLARHSGARPARVARYPGASAVSTAAVATVNTLPTRSVMPYATGPYNRFTSLPSSDETVVTGSRKIDFSAQRYAFDDNGNAEGMDPVAQRVILAVSFAGGGMPSNLDDDRELAARKQRIISALDSMVKEGVIALTGEVISGRRRPAVEVGRTSAGVYSEVVRFTNLHTQRESSVTITHG